MTLYDYCAERDEAGPADPVGTGQKQDADAKRGVLWQETEETGVLTGPRGGRPVVRPPT